MYLWNIPEDMPVAVGCVDNSDDTVYTTERLGKIPTTSFV